MPAIISCQIPTKSVSEVRNGAVSFVGILDSGELLTGTPTVEEVTTTDLTISNAAINTSAMSIAGDSAAIGQAVTFRVTGGLADRMYQIKITATTDAGLPQTLVVNAKLSLTSDA